MKKHLIITMLLMLAFMVNTNIQAQPPQGQMPSPEERADRLITNLSEKVVLTDEEKAALKPIFVESNKEMQKMFESGTRPTPEEREAMTKKRNDKVKAVLPEEKYNAYLEYMKNRRRGRGGPPPSN